MDRRADKSTNPEKLVELMSTSIPDRNSRIQEGQASLRSRLLQYVNGWQYAEAGI